MVGIQIIEAKIDGKRFKIELTRNISVIVDNSATGKSTFAQGLLGIKSGNTPTNKIIRASCNYVVLTGDFFADTAIVNSCHNTVVIADEIRYTTSKEFADLIKNNQSNYYLIINREPLKNLPYSIHSIFKLKAEYDENGIYSIYNEEVYNIDVDLIKKRAHDFFDTILVEDKKSGYQFYENIVEDTCVKSSNGNGNIISDAMQCDSQSIMVVADGAAFGPYIKEAIENNISLWLPESFEYLLLTSDIFKSNSKIKKVLNNLSNSINSDEYLSWERFFTYLIESETAGTQLAYRKDSLNKNYLTSGNVEAIIKNIPPEVAELLNLKTIR